MVTQCFLSHCGDWGITLENVQDVIAIPSVSGIAMISEFIEKNTISLEKTKKLLKYFKM